LVRRFSLSREFAGEAVQRLCSDADLKRIRRPTVEGIEVAAAHVPERQPVVRCSHPVTESLFVGVYGLRLELLDGKEIPVP